MRQANCEKNSTKAPVGLKGPRQSQAPPQNPRQEVWGVNQGSHICLHHYAPHLRLPLRRRAFFLRSEQRSHKWVFFFFHVFYFFTTFAQHRFSLKSVTQIPALSGETRKVKGSQSLGKDRHTLERPSLVSYVYTSGNIPRKRRNGCNSLSPCSGNLLFSLTERSISSFVLTSFSRYRSWYEPYNALWNTLRQPHQ